MSKKAPRRRSVSPERDDTIRQTHTQNHRYDHMLGNRDVVSELLHPAFSSYTPTLYQSPAHALTEDQDNRQYTPAEVFRGTAKAFKPARTTLSTPARLQAPSKPFHGFSPRVTFEAPQTVLTCIRRNRRTQVLHALKKTGKGTGYGKKRLTPHSQIGCK